jgi:omega-6 fatty acid desaturase (delta-12 desaturase)
MPEVIAMLQTRVERGDPRARRHDADLLRASKAYAREWRWVSWWHLLSTLTIFSALIAIACVGDSILLLRLPASILAGLVLVRLFIVYHDYQHGTVLRGAPLASVVMWAYGLLTLNPPSIWDRSHNHHHKNTAKIFGAGIGSYPVMTVGGYGRAGRAERFGYAATRHPLTIALGYFTIFFYGMCVRSLLTNPRAHWDSAAAIAVHGSLAVFLAIMYPAALVFALLIPSAVAAAMGAYLFYAQHNYPSVKLHDRAAWDYVAAALESSSLIRMSPMMHWFTGNIGYHHVHHLNARIPFYRLPEAMAALPDMQHPGTTSLSSRDIATCLRLKLWDPGQQKLTGFA